MCRAAAAREQTVPGLCLLRTREVCLVSQFAYLVIREGAKWSDVFRLIPGQSVTIGRAPTSQIVLNDERCSRNHVEIFLSSGQWTLRDLESRNGTFLGNQMVRGDHALTPGDIIRIGRTQLLFVHKLSDAFTTSGDAGSVIRRLSPDAQPPHATGPLDEGNVLVDAEPTTITHRRGQTKFLAAGEEEPIAVSKMGRAAAKLCRLAFELAKAADVAAMAELALAGLAESTQTDAGALLLFAAPPLHEPRGEDLEIVASRSTSAHRYHRVSNFLASTVLREGEAVLARNVVDDSTLGTRDSQGEILATSVICAPVRRGGTTVRTDPPLLDQPRAGARSRRPGVHLGRGRHGGRGAGEHPPPAGIGREPDPRPQRKRRAARAAGHFQRHHRRQHRHPPGDRGNRPRRGHQLHRADPRRERRGQGVGRPRRALQQRPPRQRVRLPQLRRAVGRSAGQRAVRPRAGRLHRRAPSARSASSRPPTRAR